MDSDWIKKKKKKKAKPFSQAFSLVSVTRVIFAFHRSKGA